jgi:hypothetical protein
MKGLDRAIAKTISRGDITPVQKDTAFHYLTRAKDFVNKYGDPDHMPPEVRKKYDEFDAFYRSLGDYQDTTTPTPPPTAPVTTVVTPTTTPPPVRRSVPARLQ